MQDKILIVVHRFLPYEGGSERNSYNMARALRNEGLDVTILAHENQGDYDGFTVTNDYNILLQKWRLIIVHGGDCVSQNLVHYNCGSIPSPVLYWIIKPSESPICMRGLNNHRWIGVYTTEDIMHVKKHGVQDKSVIIPYGMDEEDTSCKSLTMQPFYNKNLPCYSIPEGQKLFVSAGGFWEHKGMQELADLFSRPSLAHCHLYLFGYHGEGPKNTPHNVHVFKDISRPDLMQTIYQADAYIMNSTDEGFGLVLLEAMLNGTRWIARDIAGAHIMQAYGLVYNTKESLYNLIMNYFVTPVEPITETRAVLARDFVLKEHSLQKMAEPVISIVRQLQAEDYKIK